MLHDRFRTHTMTVTRAGRTSDGAGGWVEAHAPVGTVTGSLQPGGAAETDAADQPRAEARWIFYTDPDVDITRGDELLIDTRTFEVLSEGRWEGDTVVDHWAFQLEQVQRAGS